MSGKADRELALQAMLAEYDTLRTEIQNRSDLQNRFIQLHVTAITIVIGLLLQEGFEVYDGFIVIIALSSSVFGLWWIDQAVTITRIGCHLADPIERNVNALVNTNVLRWEAEDRNPLVQTYSETVMQRQFKDLVALTFVWPARVALGWAVGVVGWDALTTWRSDSGSLLNRIDVYVVGFMIVFVGIILYRLAKSKKTMEKVGEAAAVYKKRLRGEPLDEHDLRVLAELDDETRWATGQERIRQALSAS